MDLHGDSLEVFSRPILPVLGRGGGGVPLSPVLEEPPEPRGNSGAPDTLRPEEVGAAGGTAVPWGSAGGHGAGGFSPGVRWSITSSRRLSAIPTALREPPGTARSEVDTLGSEEADSIEKRGEPPRRPPRAHLWLPRGGGRARVLQDPPRVVGVRGDPLGSPRCRARQ